MSHLQSIDVSTLVATQMGGGSASRKPLWAVFCIWFNTEGGIEDVKEVTRLIIDSPAYSILSPANCQWYIRTNYALKSHAFMVTWFV